MSKSQNGWAAHETSSQMVPLTWITGRTHPDTVAIFDDLCRRFQAEVEPIIRAHSWGWNYRPIRGRVNLSNHASGTAIDLNAPAHPLGKKDTFTAPQRAAIRRILARYGGAITWGGDWTARPDDMHFEVTNGTTAATLRRITAALTAPNPTTPSEEDTMTPAQMAEIKAHQSAEANRVRDEIASYVTGNEKGKGAGQVTTRALYDQGERQWARSEQIHAWEKATSAKDPAAIVDLIPAGLAAAVADELAARLKG